ncbi:phytoene/squalene synthase family protein [Alkalihalobacillus hwajinpoensis]|uniref:phytoene/squalene synthase family protein n=1 Tax=Guptibacillus hwajinpoensis TaxID=208199 RepID=UPI001883CBFC|nr:phytoene/squalene synthase family protein [Pseudalkalibacillus hwajinpoensis]MBF0708649.1 phytoene/squalene synthase family protein [Pseudalkalibacillus hwajinpoensis]
MLEQAYAHCEAIIKHHSKTFYKAFSLLPSSKKKAVWAVYGFCRQVDDIIDEGTDPEAELKVFRSEFASFLKGEIPKTDPMWLALEDVFRNFTMDTKAFHDMIAGQEMDLYKTKYYTLEELEHYSYHVASTVGLMLLPILAPKKVDELRESAIALGLGMQITNILRDISEDLDRDRIYLPIAEMESLGYRVEDLRSRRMNEAFIKVWEKLAVRAEMHYETAFSAMHHYPLDARLPVKSSAVFYKAILQSIRKKDYNVFHQRAFVSEKEKEALLSAIAGN